MATSRVRAPTVALTASLTSGGAIAVAAGGLWRMLALGGAALGLGASLSSVVVAKRVLRAVLFVEVPVLLLLASSLVWRVRTTDDIAADPLDAAGQIRVGCVGLAGLLALTALVWPSRTEARVGRVALPFRLYGAYVLVVFAGAPLSVQPLLTAYRGVELATAVLVLLAARQSVGLEAIGRIGTTLFWFLVALVGSVWAGVLVFPGLAVQPLLNEAAPIPWNVQGVYPSIASNGVGTLGVTLTIWSLARARPGGGGRPLRPALAYALAAVGVVTLGASQYRTGYGALAIGVAVLLALRNRRMLLVAVLLGSAIWMAFLGPQLVEQAAPFLLRGQTAEEARGLTSRVEWWEASIPVWEKSPLVGRGLLTGTRFEVLARLGLRDTGGIHSTWVEVLVGTGLIGLGLLLASAAVSLRRALTLALTPGGAVLPLLLLTVMLVRSVTGNTFESFQGLETVTFMWLALSLGDGGRAWREEPQ
ncbi:MAG TPA: O-antigen ligase family protein [Actinomycetes bacterium]|jgi:O-antigen ligase|nr:O-antigen ligase family protein [Actinomycetes bacterium]